MSVLEKIFRVKHEEVVAAKAITAESDLRARAADATSPRGFRASLIGRSDVGLIAEVKKASPSKGIIRPNFDPVEIAKAYEAAGASALSVLTDIPHFQGHPDFLVAARAAVSLPVLRKDFVDDPYQVWEARAWGADAVLLIVAALELSQIVDLQGLIWSLGMDALVEVHTEAEAEVAVAAKSNLIGVNNRDLGDFHEDLAVSERILPLLKDAVRVSESSLGNRTDIDRVKSAGADAVLIGTSFCAAPNIEQKVREVMAW